jgi:hypothetical protein
MALLTDPVTNGVTPVPSDYWAKVSRLLNTTVFYNVRNQDFGAAGDGIANDRLAIQNCINNSTAGSTILFPPGTYLVDAPIVRKPNRHYIGMGGWSDDCVIKVANNSSANFQATGGVSGVLVPESWDSNATVATGPVTIMGLAVNGNRANNATGQHCGFILGHGEYWSHYENLYAYECKLDGFRFTPLGKNGSSLMAAGISDFRIRDLLATQNTGNGMRSIKSGGRFETDIVWDGNNLMFFNDESGVFIDEAANWQIDHLHMWQNGKHGMRCADGSYACRFQHIYVEDIGRLGTSGEFLSGVEIKTFNGRSPTLHDCTVSVNVPLSGVNHRGIVVNANDTDAHAWVHDNEVRAEGVATSAMYGFVFDNGSGGSKLTLHEHTNHAYGFVAGQDKGFFGTATYAFDPPRVMTGSAAWTPGAIGANSGATTSVTVIGAALGDQIAVGYNQDLQAGLILTAEVSAANTVTAQIRNVTAGSLTPTAGTVRVTVWKH